MAAEYRGYSSRRPLAARAAPPTQVQIAGMVPDGCRRLLGRHVRRLYLDVVAQALAEDGARCDARANVLAVAGLLAGRASWATATTRYPAAELCRDAGISLSTWKAARRRLERLRLLRTVTPGRKYHHGDQSRSDAAVYVLICPRWLLRKIAARHRRRSRWPRTRPPTVSPSVDPRIVRGADSPGQGQLGPPCGRALPGGGPRNAELARMPGAGRAMAEAIRRRAGAFVTDGWCGHLARPFLAARWTASDLARALEQTPAGSSWAQVARELRRAGVRMSPVAFARWKLAHWTGRDGRALDPPSARDAAGLRAAQAAERAAREQRERARADGIPAGARAILAGAGLLGRARPEGPRPAPRGPANREEPP